MTDKLRLDKSKLLGFSFKGEPLFDLVAAKNDLDLATDNILSGTSRPTGNTKRVAKANDKITSVKKTNV